MAADANSGDSGGSGGADRHGSSEANRPDNPWRRIETEQPERDATRTAWDAKNDPSPEFEHAARPLGNNYGRDRPQHRELTAEQRADLEETFGRPAEELLALREQDPRAGHNRDEQGRILHHNNPQPDRTPEQTLRKAEHQAKLHDPDTNAPDLQAPSDQPSESGPSGEAEDDAASDSGNSGNGSDRTDQGLPDDDPDNHPAETTHRQTTDVQPTTPAELHTQLGDLAAELRSGRLTPTEAADHLDNLRPSLDSSPQQEPESDPTEYRRVADVQDAVMLGKERRQIQHEVLDQPVDSPGVDTTELVRQEGSLRFERGTVKDDGDRPGEQTRTGESDKVDRQERLKTLRHRVSPEAINDGGKMVDRLQQALREPPPPDGTRGDAVMLVPSDRQPAQQQADNGQLTDPFTAVALSALIVYDAARTHLRKDKSGHGSN